MILEAIHFYVARISHCKKICFTIYFFVVFSTSSSMFLKGIAGILTARYEMIIASQCQKMMLPPRMTARKRIRLRSALGVTLQGRARLMALATKHRDFHRTNSDLGEENN